MNVFSSAEDSSTSAEIVLSAKKPDISNCLAVCVLSFYIKKTLAAISQSTFAPASHASPYNTYMREKGKLSSASKLDLFLHLRSIGISCRIVYKISAKKKITADESLEIVSGGAVIIESELDGSPNRKHDKESIHVSIDVHGTVINHTLYAHKKVAQALECEVSRSTEISSPFYAYDSKHINTLPATRREGLLHPLYRIDPEHRRYVIYPKSIGWVGHIKDAKTKVHTMRSKTQKEVSMRIYPKSHLCKLLTYNEVLRQNKRVENISLPFRVLPGNKKFHPEGLKVYAPWQIQEQPENAQIIATPKQIPEDKVYLVETSIIKYNLEGATPVIGKRYDHITQKKEPVSSGVLLSKKYFDENREIIKQEMHRSIIGAVTSHNKPLVLNMQVLAVQALRYIHILESL
ncbi:hypothetical protein NEMIN01_0336 [Nematocida minor]|uniref:uncharacterized protein n=1 Tax=Nematocida minor TaxID=1912983 RepID=UPI00221E6B95|nr:uncharacterized protein NEMIN01_0336 [Nematocida minor]KAI5189170.1 hypothetical protein NEMIN01_0336 [Nematocida minor]